MQDDQYNRPGMPPSESQLAHFRAYCDCGSLKAAAVREGIAYSTLKNSLSALYSRLGVGGAIEALFALGWVVTPDAGSCGWVGRCSRNEGHAGPHGGFRSVTRRAA